jgi:hypothetical protein
VSAQIIDKEEEIFVSTWSRWRHRVAQVTMNKFKSMLCLIFCFTWKRQPSLLVGETAVAYLIYMINEW